MEETGLRRATRQRIGARGVLSIFDDIEIEAAQFTAAKVMYPVIHEVELIVVVGRPHVGLQCLRLPQNPAIQRQQLLDRQAVGDRVKTGEIGEQKARRVADTSVGIGGAF